MGTRSRRAAYPEDTRPRMERFQRVSLFTVRPILIKKTQKGREKTEGRKNMPFSDVSSLQRENYVGRGIRLGQSGEFNTGMRLDMVGERKWGSKGGGGEERGRVTNFERGLRGGRQCKGSPAHMEEVKKGGETHPRLGK